VRDTVGVQPLITAESNVYRRARRRGRRVALLGIALIGYGIIGIAIFAIVATSIDRPLERVRELTRSVEQQRIALVDSMQQAESTLSQMSRAVGRMDASLGDAKLATDRSAGIASSVSTSMYGLRDAMSVEIPLIGQPLVGLAAGFDQAGAQLSLLSQDLATIGTSLDSNRTDVVATAENLGQLATSVATLTDSVRTGPGVEISTEALETFRLAIFAVAAWVVLFAIGCVAAGLYLVVHGLRAGRDLLTDEPHLIAE
jgi:hypothetical protein